MYAHEQSVTDLPCASISWFSVALFLFCSGDVHVAATEVHHHDAAPAAAEAVEPVAQEAASTADLVVEQQVPVPAAKKPVPEPVAPAAVPAFDTSALESVQRSVEQLTASQRSFVEQARASAQATEAKLSALQQAVAEGNQAAAESARAAAAAAAAAASQQQDQSASSTVFSDVEERLGALERDLKSLKSILSSFVSEQAKANAAAAEAAKASSTQIMAALSNATAAATAAAASGSLFASFNHTVLLEQGKVQILAASSALGRLVTRGMNAAQEHLPLLQKHAQEWSEHGLEHASVLSVQATKATHQAHGLLSDVLLQQGVPKEYVSAAVWSALGLVALVAFIIVWSLIKCTCRCCCRCCCGGRRRSAHTGVPSGGAAAARKKNH
jgi:hypothetical protein